MFRRFVPISKNGIFLFNWLLSNLRSLPMNTDSSEMCSSTQMVDISKLTSKKSHRISVNHLVTNARNVNEPSTKHIKLNQKMFPPERPTECCNSQCECCVWILYLKEIAAFYEGDKDKIEEALNYISDIDTRNYVRKSYESFV